jgi:hypothetical protein
MMNISGFGLAINLTASKTFPAGFVITEFADDTDPVDSPDVDIADTAMGLNGDFLLWARPQSIEVSVAVIAGTPSDINLGILFEANRVAKRKSVARDIVGLNVSYPNGLIATLSNGVMVAGQAMPQIASAGRFKTRTYRFRFETITKTGQ